MTIIIFLPFLILIGRPTKLPPPAGGCRRLLVKSPFHLRKGDHVLPRKQINNPPCVLPLVLKLLLDQQGINIVRFSQMEYIKKLQALATNERKKKVPETPGILKEIGIHVLAKSKMVENVLRDVPNPLYLPILNTLTVGELKRRIRGLTEISIRQMMLVYRGTVLHDTATIPEEAFELLHPLSFFEDLYRPKVYLRVFSREAIEHDDNSDNGDDDDKSDASDGLGALTGEAFPENYVMEEDYHVDKMSRAESAGSFMLDDLQIAKYIKEQTFDLQLELERIQSEGFFDVLHAEGYADEVMITCVLC